jgi:DNA polymerase-1
MIDPTLMVIDGHHALHRVLSCGAFSELHNRHNLPTGGIYGVLVTLRSVLKEYPSVNKCVYVWDGGRSLRRMGLYPEYKANRGKQRSEAEQNDYTELFESQKRALHQLLPSLGVHQLILENREGDDLCGLLCRICDEPKVIVTEDKDMFQLVSDDTCIWRPSHRVQVDNVNFRNLAKVSYDLFLLSKSLIGDAGDNIAGIPKVGDKTVAKVVAKVEEIGHEGGSRTFDELEVPFIQACTALQEEDKRNRKRYQTILENVGIIRRNWDMVDISKERFTSEEISVARVVMSERCALREMDVVAEFGDLEFASLLEKWSWWAEPFRRFQ